MCQKAWTDSDMYDWTIGEKYRHVFDKKAHIFWNALYEFSKSRDLLDDNFNGRLANKQLHGCFWELYLPRVFYEYGIELKKPEISKSSSQPSYPDFYFEHDGKRVWIEAAAVGDIKSDTMDSLEDEETDFERGIQGENDPLKFRLTNTMDGKIEKYKSAIERDPFVIAFNGYKAVCGQADPTDFPEMPWPSRIESILLGTGNFYLEREDGIKNLLLSSKSTIRKHATATVDVGYFAGHKYSHISGLIYSNSHLWQCDIALNPLGQDFLFIPNPYATHKADNIFSFCRPSKWCSRG